MTNLKDYQDKELRYYLFANIAILLLLLDLFPISQSDNLFQIIDLVSTFFGVTLISSTIYIFALIVDSLFGSEIKMLLIGGRSPGSNIFSKIKKGTFDNRFTYEDAQKIYSKVYDSMPNNKKDRHSYENAEWYKIYNKHREVTMIIKSNRNYLLCRDIYFSTIANVLIYLILTLGFKIIFFDWRYICYLTAMLIFSNIGTRNKGMRFVCNVIAYDIANNTTKLKENENG